MKKRLFVLVFCSNMMLLFSQTTTNISLIQGNSEDAYLAFGAPTSNYGSHPSMGGNTWTCGGFLCLSRGLFKFDMSSIPTTAVVLSASLQLFGDLNWSNSPTTGGPANSGILSRVTSPWQEFSVTWNTQPSTSPVNSVSIPGSTSTAQNYTLNVTGIVQDILSSGNNYGFLLKMQDEVNYYLSLMFASSDNANASKIPILTVTYLNPALSVTSSTFGCGGLTTATAMVTGGSGNYSYTWTPSAQNSSLATSLSPGVYTITVLDNTYNSTFTFTSNVMAPVFNFTNTLQSTPLCGSSNATITGLYGSGNYTYSWSPGNFLTSSVNNLSLGVYTATVYDITNSCASSGTLQITPYTFPNLTVSPSSTICTKQVAVLTVSGANTYLWSNGSTANSQTVAPTVSSIYTVTGTNTLTNCSSVKTVSVAVTPCIGLDDYMNTQAQVLVQPNPFDQTFNIESKVPMGEVVVVDLLGKQILREYPKSTTYWVDRSFEPGIYTLLVYGPNQELFCRKKVICNH